VDGDRKPDRSLPYTSYHIVVYGLRRLCAGVKYPEVILVSVNSKNEQTRRQGEDQRGVPEVLSCGGHFRQRNTKTVVIKHHARKRGRGGIDIHHVDRWMRTGGRAGVAIAVTQDT